MGFGKSPVLESALKKLPNYEGVVFRSTQIGDEKLFASLLREGSIVSDKDFLSASRSHKIEDVFSSRLEEGVFMAIRSRTGKSVEEVSNLSTTQKEIVFKPGTRFIFEAVQKRPDGSHIVYLDEVF